VRGALNRPLLAAALLSAALCTGCYTSTVRSGLPPGRVAPALDGAYHQGFLFGLVEATGPHDLTRACPEGWAVIETVTDPLDAAVSLLTLFIITPQRVTVVCAANGPRAGPPNSYPPARSVSYPPPPESP
jgi:hypothetical protein